MSDIKQHSDQSESIDKTPAAKAPWSWYKKFIFRVLFVFFLAMSIPFTGSWYNNVFTLDWLHPHYRDLYDIARFQPSFRSFFGGGRRGGGDITDAPADNSAPGGDEGKGGGRRHHRNDADTAQAGGSDQAGGGEGHRHHHNRDSTGGGGHESGGFGGHGNGGHHHRDSTLTAGNEGGGERHHHHHRDSTGNAFAGNPDGGHDHGGRHHRDSTLTAGNGGGGGGRHHHHRDSTSATFTNNNPEWKGHHGHHRDSLVATLAAGGNEGGGRHHHHRDSTGGAGSAADGFGGHGRHHGDSSATDSSGHGLAKIGGHGNNNDRANTNINDVLPPSRNFLEDYTDWGIAFLIGIAGALIWTIFDRKSKSYNILYYWIRVVVRYRAGIGIIGFGFTKLFPTQMPYPSLGLLNSNFGDFTAQKIYWMSVGIVPWYQVFGGVIEIAAGAMLFFRKTSTFGAILLAAALGDITFVNYAYDGGVHVYAFYFVLLGLFIAADDFPKLYNLLILERYTVPFRVYPDFRKPWLKYIRITLKVLTFVIFFGVLTYTEVINFKYDPYKQPSTAGVKTLRGNYHVTEFKVNGQDIPYNPLDSTRWQEATFENWTTLTFRVNHPVLIDPSNGGGSPMHDIQRTFEITGVAGGERAFHYYADTVDKVLYLQDKNIMGSRGGGRGGRKPGGNRNGGKPKEDNWISQTAWQHIGSEKDMIDKHAWSARRDREFAAKQREPKRNRMVLKYDTTDGSRVILTGINERKDSIYVVLDRYDRKYTLPKSTLSAGKY
jgi:hypothetical protein